VELHGLPQINHASGAVTTVTIRRNDSDLLQLPATSLMSKDAGFDGNRGEHIWAKTRIR